MLPFCRCRRSEISTVCQLKPLQALKEKDRQAVQGNHEKMRKRWPPGSVPHHFSRELKEMQGLGR